MRQKSAEVPQSVREMLTLLDVAQVCDLLNVKRDWLYDEVREDRIPHVRLGRAIRFRPADLDAYLSAKFGIGA